MTDVPAVATNICDHALARELIRAALTDHDLLGPLPSVTAALTRIYADEDDLPSERIMRLLVALAVEAERCALFAAVVAEPLTADGVLDFIAAREREHTRLVRPSDDGG